MICIHRGVGIGATVLQDSSRVQIFACAERGQCTDQNAGLKVLGSGDPFPSCATCHLYTDNERQRYRAIASSDSPTGFVWDCPPEIRSTIGFTPTGPTDTVTIEPNNSQAEQVGDHLAAILEECGIEKPACSSCDQWRTWMNRWGVAGCQKNREKILARLNEQAKAATWWDKIRIAGRGYITTSQILDEAIKRADHHRQN